MQNMLKVPHVEAVRASVAVAAHACKKPALLSTHFNYIYSSFNCRDVQKSVVLKCGVLL